MLLLHVRPKSVYNLCVWTIFDVNCDDTIKICDNYECYILTS